MNAVYEMLNELAVCKCVLGLHVVQCCCTMLLATRQPPTFKLSKVTVNAKLTLQAINELEPLIVWMNDSTLNHAR